MEAQGTTRARRREAPAPMLATSGPPPPGSGWSIEWKFDGQRGLIVADGAGEVSVYSRNGMDITRCFPDVAAAAAKSLNGRAAVLDGEIVVLDSGGRPSFELLQQRWPQQRRPSPDLLGAAPAGFYAFDLLAIDGADVTRMPYRERRGRLEDSISGRLRRVAAVPRFDSAELAPIDALAVAAEHRMEGIVTKRLDSPYTPGLRSTDWIKTCHRNRSEFLIGGWLPGDGPNRNAIGALLVGAYSADGELLFCGTVGSGLSAAHRRVLGRLLTPLTCTASPFANDVPVYIARHARWVNAETAGDVEYREMRGLLRHPSWKGLRADLSDLSTVTVPAESA